MVTIEIDRALDANLNRIKEGFRVIEDINRYIFNDAKISLKIKELRHRCRSEDLLNYLKSRDVDGDIGKEIDYNSSITTVIDILISNYKRVEESARTLEELFKINNIKLSFEFKDIRYKTYQIEKIQFKNIDVYDKNLLKLDNN